MDQSQNHLWRKSTTSGAKSRAKSVSNTVSISAAAAPRNEERTHLLECNSCRLRVYDAWKGVRCEHILCTECMVRTSQQLIHCQICITLCVRQGDHAMCIVCFGCDLLCRCPERLELALFGPEFSGKKSIEFYERLTRRPSAVPEGLFSPQPGRNEGEGNPIYRRELQRERHVVEEDIMKNKVEEKINVLYTRMQEFDQRVKLLEHNYERMQSKVKVMGKCPAPRAVFQSKYDIQSSAVGGLQKEEATNGDFIVLQQSQHQLYNHQYQQAFQAQGYQTPEEILAEDIERQPGTDGMVITPQLPNTMPEQFSQQPNFNFPVDSEGNPLQPKAIMAVIKVTRTRNPDPSRLTPENGPDMDFRKDAEMIIKNTVKVCEIPEGKNIGAAGGNEDKDKVKGADDRYGYSGEERWTENNLYKKYSNPIWDVQDKASDAFTKKDAETPVKLESYVKQMAKLFDKLNYLEADNARIRNDHMNLKKASTKILDKVNSICLEKEHGGAIITPSQPAKVEQGQQATRGGMMSRTALQISVKAVVDQGSSDDALSTEASADKNCWTSGLVTSKQGNTKCKGKSDINIEIRNGPNGPVNITQGADPAKDVGYVQDPQQALNRGAALEQQNRRTTSLPTQPFDTTTYTEKDLETYKKRMDDITDWCRTRRQRDMFLEQTTWSYLNKQLTNSCHFLDFVSSFYWEVNKCSKLCMGKASVSDFRVFGGPIIDLASMGLFRFVIDPSESSIIVYVEILISANPKRDHRYHLKISSVRSGKPFHEKQYTGEEMFGFKGVLSYPGTPCLGFFSVSVDVSSKELNNGDRTLNDTLIIELAKVQAP